MRWFGWVAAGLLMFSAGSARAELLVGEVVGVVDGDTIWLKVDRTRVERIRLAGIDAPERGQPFGSVAKQALSHLVYGRRVAIEWSKRDRWNRIIGKVVVPASPACVGAECLVGEDAGRSLIGRGLAWWFWKYAHEQSPDDAYGYRRAECSANASGLALWSDATVVAPWDWRRGKASRGTNAVSPALVGEVCLQGGDSLPRLDHPGSTRAVNGLALGRLSLVAHP